jgi:hypothetical protein
MMSWLPPLLVGAVLLIGALGEAAQAGSGEGQAAPNAAAAGAPNEAPAAGAAAGANDPATTGSIDSAGPEAGTTGSTEPAQPPPQKLLCMWRNKGVTGFCDVAPETPVGTSCSCKSIIEHKAKKFSGKVIVSR